MIRVYISSFSVIRSDSYLIWDALWYFEQPRWVAEQVASTLLRLRLLSIVLLEGLTRLLDTVKEAGFAFVVLPEANHIGKFIPHHAKLLCTVHMSIAAQIH